MDTSKIDLSSVKSTEHVSFTSAEAVKQICTPLLQKLGLNAFSYSRIYADGSRAELWTDPLALEHTFIIKNYLKKVYSPDFFKNVRYCMFENQVKNYAHNLVDQYVKQLGDQREIFDHDSCFLIIKRCIQYVEYFIFYAPRECTGAVNTYFNYLGELENFTDYFLVQADDLIKKVTKERLIPAWRIIAPLQEALVM